MKLVILGLSITSSWGNGHAAQYRALVKSLVEQGHEVLFLERSVPWYASNRDLPVSPYGRTVLYRSFSELQEAYGDEVRTADVVLVGSCVPEGVAIGYWVTSMAQGIRVFYDLDTPLTLNKLNQNDCEYLSYSLIPRYDLYLSTTGGPTLKKFETSYHARAARALYCCIDPREYYSDDYNARWDMGYLGSYHADCQAALEHLLFEPARRSPRGRFVVAGNHYPGDINWPENVEQIDQLSPTQYRDFYNSQRFTLQLTRRSLSETGFTPSVQLFRAAACGTPIISDYWYGLDSFFEPGKEILLARTPYETLDAIEGLSSAEARATGERARKRVLAEHSSELRVQQLIGYIEESQSVRASYKNVANL